MAKEHKDKDTKPLPKNITLSEQADGSGFYRFRINKNGVKLSKSFPFTSERTKGQALRLCTDFSTIERDEITISGKSYSRGRGVLLSDLLEAYKGSSEVLAMKSSKTRIARVRILIEEPTWKQYLHRTIDEIKKENLIGGLVDAMKKGGYTPSTINHYLVIISRSLRWASIQPNKSEWQFLGDISITKGHSQAVKNERLVFITDEDFEKLLSIEEDEETKYAYIFLNETACRRGELMSLMWQNVNLEEAWVDLKNTKSGRDRRIPLTKKAVEVLTSKQKQKDKPKADDFVFNFAYSYLSHHFNRQVKRLGWQEKGYCLHDIRARNRFQSKRIRNHPNNYKRRERGHVNTERGHVNTERGHVNTER